MFFSLVSVLLVYVRLNATKCSLRLFPFALFVSFVALNVLFACLGSFGCLHFALQYAERTPPHNVLLGRGTKRHADGAQIVALDRYGNGVAPGGFRWRVVLRVERAAGARYRADAGQFD